MNDTWYTLAVIAGIAAVSVVNRSFFFISRQEVPLPEALKRGLRYAPLAALVAVITPEIVMRNGALTTWNDARLYAALAAIGWHLYRPGMLGTILAGMGTYLALRFAAGW